MKLAIILLSVVAATLVQQSSAGLMGNMMDNPMVSAMLPPGCKEAVNGLIAKAKKTHTWITKEKCDKVCGGKPVTAKLMWPHKDKILAAVKGVFHYLKNVEKLDIDTICPENLKEADIYTVYAKGEKECIKGMGEFDAHKDLCHAKEGDFPKTSKCVEKMAMAEFKARTSPPKPMPIGCASDALKKYCTKPFMDKIEKFWFGTARQNMKPKEIPKPHYNPWYLAHQFFDVGKCSGKVEPL